MRVEVGAFRNAATPALAEVGWYLVLMQVSLLSLSV